MKRLIVITTPYFFGQEGPVVSALFDEGMECLHVRKPGCSRDELVRLLKEIPEMYHPRIRLHDHFELYDRFRIGGLHLNKRNHSVPPGYKGCISRSCHSLQEVKENDRLDYVFLSPVFRSISKEGYGSGFSIDTLRKASDDGIINEKVIALGGMDMHTIPAVADMNFGGVAVLGALWGIRPEEKEPALILEQYKRLQP